MTRSSIVAAMMIVSVAVASLSMAAVKLNSSKSNAYRVTYDTTVMTPAQASALLAELDKMGPADEAKLKTWLPANFKRLGIQGDRIKQISVRQADKASPTLILLLTRPADEAAALAVSDEGASGPKVVPKKTQ